MQNIWLCTARIDINDPGRSSFTSTRRWTSHDNGNVHARLSTIATLFRFNLLACPRPRDLCLTTRCNFIIYYLQFVFETLVSFRTTSVWQTCTTANKQRMENCQWITGEQIEGVSSLNGRSSSKITLFPIRSLFDIALHPWVNFTICRRDHWRSGFHSIHFCQYQTCKCYPPTFVYYT